MPENNANGSNGNNFYLCEILGTKVFSKGKRIGKLSDFVITEKAKFPEVTHLIVTRPFGEPTLFVPWEKVVSFEQEQVSVDLDELKYDKELLETALLLKDHVLDKKVIDVGGRDVEVVYDVILTLKGKKLFVSAVDFSRYGFLRRMHLSALARFIYKLAETIEKKTISWAYVQDLPTHIGSFKGDVKLNVLKEKLSDLPPVDVADILEELDPDQRVMVFNQLDSQHASDALEEVDPRVQREIISSLKKEKVAKMVNRMSPGQAADLLSALPWWDTHAILKLISKVDAEKIKSLLGNREEKVQDHMTSSFVKISPNETVEEAQREYCKIAKEKDVPMYLYVVEEDDTLLGVLDIKELLKADDNARLKEIMTDTIVALKPDSTLKKASYLFERYEFRAIPVLDRNRKILGIVQYRDIMRMIHKTIA